MNDGATIYLIQRLDTNSFAFFYTGLDHCCWFLGGSIYESLEYIDDTQEDFKDRVSYKIKSLQDYMNISNIPLQVLKTFNEIPTTEYLEDNYPEVLL
jgi:hypothetical protein